MELSRSERLARAALAAVVSTFVALGSHVIGGGHVPAIAGVLVPLGLSFVVSTQLAGRSLSLWRLAAAVSISQVLFHTLFVIGSGGATVVSDGHAHHGGTVTATLTDGAAHGAHGGGVMTAAHIAAAVLTTLALHRAEWLLERAARGIGWLRALLAPALLSRPSTPRAAALHVRPQPARHLSAADFCRAHPLRGPPALSA